MIKVLTQKDLYDYIAKHGAEAYDKMAAELADNINNAKAKYEYDQKEKDKAGQLKAARVASLARLIQDWFGDKIKPEVAKAYAEEVYNDMVDLANSNVDVKTEDIPGGKKVTIKGKLTDDDVKELVDGIVDGLGYAFNW